MTKEPTVLLEKIKKRIKNIHQKHTAVVKENLDLKAKLVAQKNIERELKEQVKVLESNVETLKLARAYGDDSKVDKGAKAKINEMVKEIDRCIALLND